MNVQAAEAEAPGQVCSAESFLSCNAGLYQRRADTELEGMPGHAWCMSHH